MSLKKSPQGSGCIRFVIEATVTRTIQRRACHAQSSEMDGQTASRGPDERGPPGVGGARLSCPMNRDRLSNVIQRTWQARPSET